MPFKMVWSTDWHVADNAPAMRIDDYTEATFAKITQIRKLCKAAKADICLIGGDVFHVKTSAKVRHALVARLIEEFQRFPCPVWSIVGNHDISHNNLVTLPEKPLGVVFSSGSLHMLEDETFTSADGVKVRIHGKHFDPKIELDHFDELKKGDEDWLAVAYHGYACVIGESYPGETTFKYSDLAKLEPDDWFFGHWHIDQGIEVLDKKQFVNIGSLTRGALNLENVTRSPKAVLCTYTKEGRKFQQVKLKVESADAVFDIRKKERTDREQTLINEFIENLRAETEGTAEDSSSEISKRITSLRLESGVRSKVISLLEDAEIELATARAGG